MVSDHDDETRDGEDDEVEPLPLAALPGAVLKYKNPDGSIETVEFQE